MIWSTKVANSLSFTIVEKKQGCLLKRHIQNSLLETAPQYGLEEDKLVYNGFCRVTGYQTLTHKLYYGISVWIQAWCYPYNELLCDNGVDSQL